MDGQYEYEEQYQELSEGLNSLEGWKLEKDLAQQINLYKLKDSREENAHVFNGKTMKNNCYRSTRELQGETTDRSDRIEHSKTCGQPEALSNVLPTAHGRPTSTKHTKHQQKRPKIQLMDDTGQDCISNLHKFTLSILHPLTRF